MSRLSKTISTVVLATLLPLAHLSAEDVPGTALPTCGEEASTDSVRCRLDDVATRVAATDVLGRFGARLAKNVARADGLLERVDGLCRDDKVRQAKRQVKRLVRLTVRAARAISSGNARRKLDAELRRELLTDVRGVVHDLKRLRRTLTCPPASVDGAFV